ncbi:MAG: Wzz/FepE/Etk N-terminal domain-containing protein [Pseudomonadota bacterium]
MKQESAKSLDRELFGRGITPTSHQDEVSLLADLLRAVWRARLWIVLAGIVGGGAAYAMSYMSEVRYASVAQVMLETRTTDDDFGPTLSGLPLSLTALESELEVLRSHDLAERVVERLSLYEDPEFAGDPDEAPPLFSLDPIKRAVRGFVDSVMGADELVTGDPSAPTAGVDLELERIVSNVVAHRAVDQIGNISAVFSIRFTSNDPQKAAALANALAEEYINSQTSAKLQALERSQGWLSARTIEVQERLAALGVELENQLLDAPFTEEEVETMKALRASAERQRNAAQERLEELTTQRRGVRRAMAQRDFAAAVAVLEDPGADLIAAAETAAGGGVGETEALRSALQRALSRLDAAIDEQRRTVDALTVEIGSFRESLVIVAEYDAETRRIENDISVSEAIYQDFVSQLSRRTQQDQFLNADARIIAYARPSLYPSEPRRSQMAVLAAVMSGFLVAVATLVLELRQTRLRTVRDFEDMTGLPLLGIIPRFNRRRAPINAMLSRKGSIDPAQVQFARKLYSSFASRNYAKPLGPSRVTERGKGEEGEIVHVRDNQIIAGASALPREGKSSSLLLLAGACAYAGERVLLLDCDFWNSPFGGLTTASPETFYQVLRDPARASELVVETDEDDLYIMPAIQGLDDPTGLVLSEDFERLVRHLAGQYDRILIDAPALLGRIDIAALYRLADMVLLMVHWNKTPGGAVVSVIKALQDVGVTPSAVAATQVDHRRAGGYGDNPFAYAQAQYT